jgi:hypothetical protein
LLQTLKQSFVPDFAVVHVFAALGSHNDGIITAENEGSASNAPTSLAGQTHHPDDRRRCPSY